MVIKTNLNAAQRQKLAEGLKELAFMIATSYRRRVSGETDIDSYSPANYDAALVFEENAAQCVYPEDHRHGGEYSETVKVENFLRRKALQVRKPSTPEVGEVNR
jgi:predicted nucleic acid-binding protein